VPIFWLLDYIALGYNGVPTIRDMEIAFQVASKALHIDGIHAALIIQRVVRQSLAERKKSPGLMSQLTARNFRFCNYHEIED
jgi:hypothetical protein